MWNRTSVPSLLSFGYKQTGQMTVLVPSNKNLYILDLLVSKRKVVLRGLFWQSPKFREPDFYFEEKGIEVPWNLEGKFLLEKKSILLWYKKQRPSNV